MTILGIDLGTTNSACGVWRDNKVELIPNRLGDYLTPSIVHYEKGNISIGNIAKEKLITDSKSTVAVFKRLMGTHHKVTLGKEHFSAIELSSMVLSSLKEDAEAYLGEPISEAVISVPAYFNDNQRLATKKAAELAGLKVERLINEPTAAAMAYGLHQKSEGTFLILDLGGGTFDVSILEFFDGVMEVHASAGDNFLGGEDFVEAMLQAFCKDNNLDKNKLAAQELQQLIDKLETAKRHISVKDNVLIEQQIKNQSISWSLDAEKFKKIVTPLLLKLRSPIQRALNDSGLPLSEIDDVILVGGATKLQLFRQVIAQLFRRMPSTHLDPDLVVAMGAAIQAGLKSKDKDLDDVVLTDVAPYSLGIAVVDDSGQGRMFHPIIERNSTVPVSRVDSFFTVHDKQHVINVDIYQGENRQVERNVSLGCLEVKVPQKPAGEESIEVRFSYDTNGLLEVDVKVVSTGEVHNKMIVNNAINISDDALKASKAKLAKIKFHPREDEDNRILLARGERLFEESLGDKRKQIGSIISEFEKVLASQDAFEIKKAQAKVKELLDAFEQEDVF